VAGKKGGAHKKGAAKKQTTTAKPRKASEAPPLGHHIAPTGDRRKRFRDEKD
jgi:hypothetical protein